MELPITLTLTCTRPECRYSMNEVTIEEEDDFGSTTWCMSCGQRTVDIPEQFEIGGHDETPISLPDLAPPVVIQSSERLKWQYPTESSEVAPSAYPLLNSPAVDAEGRMYAALQHEVVALSFENDVPSVLWKFPTGRLIPGSPTLGPDGKLRVHSLDGRLYCLTKEGRLAFDPVRVGDALGSSTPLGDLEGNTWICSATGGLLKVDLQGKLSQRAYLRSPVQFNSTGLIWNNTLYIGGEDQFVHAIDLGQSRGRELWEESQNQGRTGWYINSALAMLSDRSLIVASRDDHLYNFTLDGNLRWKVKLPGQALGSPVVDAENRIYVGLNQVDHGSLVSIDSRIQRIGWSYPTESPVESTPAIGGDGMIYFGDNQGIVHAVTPIGKPAWTESLGVPIRSPAVFPADGRIVFGLDNGIVVCLACDSPKPTSGWPKFLGTPEQSGVVMG